MLTFNIWRSSTIWGVALCLPLNSSTHLNYSALMNPALKVTFVPHISQIAKEENQD